MGMGALFNQDFHDFLKALNNIDELAVRIIHFDDLIKAKKESGRHKDKDDIEGLKS